ncbi:rRNA methylase [Amycolatopsis mediterranei S699]|uniref:rRNA methylase n=2 Tax=Amycolatopsis mediterranei TaxID=33910 RepID=A0A9R0P3J4_AMYMS|nr:rRNA methyltransferase [Amycolatopsis mediterranei]ADJ48725.1 putative rRNA methylase [Amycolatopsis mediterranei U32]AEK45661.1 rRNA methylase [Amycolatopsis mediterranei S699]AFO80434.1 rRNA methylase [Amycolatopsis mediterranei S699]AGT87562.1 rRNA methylase [Amycolatopsis mediterranei RB]KDO03941.1 rRNA methyltransferase [Amycolatopsis mediterranei]
MEHDARRRHAASFGTAAADYAEHRPDYSPAAVRWALEAASGPRVLDLGAGNALRWFDLAVAHLADVRDEFVLPLLTGVLRVRRP